METQQQLLISERQIITPLVEILEEVTPKSITIEPPSYEISKTLRQSLNDLFPEQRRDEKDVRLAKNTLGKLADQFSQEQLSDVISEIQYLAESWLDDFERKTFKGQTLIELLHERGGK